jgi:hypothetical protein
LRQLGKVSKEEIAQGSEEQRVVEWLKLGGGQYWAREAGKTWDKSITRSSVGQESIPTDQANFLG